MPCSNLPGLNDDSDKGLALLRKNLASLENKAEGHGIFEYQFRRQERKAEAKVSDLLTEMANTLLTSQSVPQKSTGPY